jgi:hypothetical protein
VSARRRGGLVKLRRAGELTCGCYLPAGSMVARLPQGLVCSEHALRLALDAGKDRPAPGARP